MTEAPTKLRLACGCDIPHEEHFPIFNFYDMKAGWIDRLAEWPDTDTSGLLPNGIAWWVGTTTGTLDGSRMICVKHAIAKGWALDTDWDE